MNQTPSIHEAVTSACSGLVAYEGPSTDPAVWVLLWSQSQNALHVERLSDMQKTNADAFRENRRTDYMPLFVGTRGMVDIMAKAVRPTVHAREESHAARRERV